MAIAGTLLRRLLPGTRPRRGFRGRRPRVGVIGCGNIGARQAANLLAHGLVVNVHDIDGGRMAELESLGAQAFPSAAAIAARSDIVITALPTPAVVTRVVRDGDASLSQGLRPGCLYIDIGTNAPDTVVELHGVMQGLGVGMLDAPINDAPAGARSRHGVALAILPSGDRDVFERARPVLELMADRVLYCGDIGNGTRCKLIHNAVNAIAVQAVSEGITLGLASGIPLDTIWDALRFGAFGQNAGDIHGLPHYWFSRRCDDPSKHPAFTIGLLHKDLKIAVDMAARQGVGAPQLQMTFADYEEALSRGWAEHAATKVRCLQEERAGVKAQPLVYEGIRSAK
jgi:3-hydroxyisobutyrate dehydrogenase-like beta-hydroxyacid dehydrogenase